MSLHAFAEIKKIKNEREYSYKMPIGAPYGEAVDVAFEVIQDILELSKKAVEAAAAQPKEPEIVMEDDIN